MSSTTEPRSTRRWPATRCAPPGVLREIAPGLLTLVALEEAGSDRPLRRRRRRGDGAHRPAGGAQRAQSAHAGGPPRLVSKRASADHSVGVVVLTGTGERAFCTGADLDEQEAFLERPNDYWDWMGRFIEAIESIKDCAKPVGRAAQRHDRRRRQRAQPRLRPGGRGGRHRLPPRRAVARLAARRWRDAVDAAAGRATAGRAR
jgi:hypothetical protein